MRKTFLTVAAMLVAVTALVFSSQAENVSLRGDYVEVRTASVFAGACHFNGEVVTTDGPFAEAKEQLGGFWEIKCADLDAALAWAGEATAACQAPVEVRPFQDEAEE